MDDTRARFRAFWVPIGVAVLIAGYIGTSEWIFAVEASPSARHLHVLNLALILPGCLVILGLWVIVAGMSPSQRIFLRLPGKRRAFSRAERIAYAHLSLSTFLMIGSHLRQDREPTTREANDFRVNTATFVTDAYGRHHGQAIMRCGDNASADECVARIMDALTKVIYSSDADSVMSDFGFEVNEKSWWQYQSESLLAWIRASASGDSE